MSAGDDGHRRPRYGLPRQRADNLELHPGCRLTIEDLVSVSRGNLDGTYPKVVLSGDWRGRCRRSRDHIADALDKARVLLAQCEAKEQEILERPVGGPWSVAKTAKEGEIDRLYADIVLGALSQPISNKLALFIYGVTTGFGSNKDKPLSDDEEISELQRNILLSHAVGTGDALPTEVVRAMILLRIRTFIEGRSGVRPELVELLLDMLNKRVHPLVPAQGSVGASGDLCPLAHVGLTLLGEGYAWVGDRGVEDMNVSRYARPTEEAGAQNGRPPLPSREALAAVGLEPLEKLEAKEGLAITNGAVLSAALAALAVHDADVLLGTANLCGALTLQAMLGFTRAFDIKVQRARHSSAQEDVAAQVMSFARGGRLLNRAREVQDAYSLRCIPQVHGAVLSAIDHAWDVIAHEINAQTDNPLFFVEDGELGSLSHPEDERVCVWDAYSCGNFHGEPVALVADYLKMAVAELASISERRTLLLLDSSHNRGLPENLVRRSAGLNNGLMIGQYTAAGLVSENKILSHPAVVDSIPTSANIEDHVSMSPIAARNLRTVLDNTRNVLAIELIAGLQAVELHVALAEEADRDAPDSYRFLVRGPLDRLLAPPCLEVHRYVRDEVDVPFLESDRQLWDLVAAVQRSIHRGEILGRASTKL